MAILAGVLNGKNIDRDFDFQSISSFLCKAGVRKGFDGELEVQENLVKPGQAFVEVERGNVLHTETFLVPVQVTSDFAIDTSTDGEIILRVDQNRVDNGSGNTETGDNIAIIEKVDTLPENNFIHLATIAGGVIEDKRAFANISDDIISSLNILDEDDVQTLVQDSLNNGDISLPENLSSLWDGSTIIRHDMRGFAFRNPYQYIYGSKLYDMGKKMSWSLPSLRTTGGGGFISDTELIYCTNTEIRKATLNPDGTTDTEDLNISSNISGCSVFVKEGKVYINNNAGMTTSSIINTSTGMTARYNYSTKRIRYDVISGVNVDFSQYASVGDQVQIGTSVNSVNNRTRTVTDLGMNFIEFAAGDISQGVPITVTKTRGGGSVSGSSFNYSHSNSGSSNSGSINMNVSGLQSGDRLVVGASLGTFSGASGYGIAISINGNLDQATGNYNSHSVNVTGSTATVGVSSSFWHSQPGWVQTTGNMSASRYVAGGTSEQVSNNRTMIVGGSESRIIRAYDISGTDLVADTPNDIYLPFELDDFCDEFVIDTQGNVLMTRNNKISAIFKADETTEILDTETTPIYPYLAYIQSTDKTYHTVNIDNTYHILPYPF